MHNVLIVKPLSVYYCFTKGTTIVFGKKIVFVPPTEMKMVCVCPTLPDITHGTVIRPDVATVGSTAQYQCEPTHELDGPSIRTCQADGTWSGAEPHCESEYIIRECIITEVNLHSNVFACSQIMLIRS